MAFGKRLIELCKAKSISLSQLSKDVGIPKATLHGWTTGRNSARPDQIKKLASFFKVPVHVLIFGEPDPFQPDLEDDLTEVFHGDLRVTIHRIERK
jgi:transcriptional regulator with XRE-family HTH domain